MYFIVVAVLSMAELLYKRNFYLKKNKQSYKRSWYAYPKKCER